MDEKYRQYRFTVNSEDATNINDTEYMWNLRFGSIIEQNSRVMMSIETIHSSSRMEYVVGANGNGVDDVSDRIERLQEQNIGYFHGNHSCFQIRCPNVNSRYFYDTHDNNNIPLIYCGALYLQNTNPKESYIFEVNKDICNGEFKLFVFDDNGAGTNLPGKFTITFILHEYRE